MTTTITQETLLGKAISGDMLFVPKVEYDKAGDCITYYAEDVANNAVWVDPYLTVYFDIEDARPVGFKLKSVNVIAKKISQVKADNFAVASTLAGVLDRLEQVFVQAAKGAKARKVERQNHIAVLVRNSRLGRISMPPESPLQKAA